MTNTTERKQTGRMILVECLNCALKFRLSNKQVMRIDPGACCFACGKSTWSNWEVSPNADTLPVSLHRWQGKN